MEISQMPSRLRLRVVLPLLGIGALAVSQAALASIRPHAPLSGRLAARPAFMTRAAVDSKTPVLFWSDVSTDAVYLVDANNISGPALGKITDGTQSPAGIAVDAKGVLYVATAGGLLLYQPGALHPFRTITDPEGRPGGVAIGADGTLAVTFGGGIFKNGVVDVFDKGSATPTRRIPVSLNGEDALFMSGVSVDSSDNVYLSLHHYPDGPAGVFKFAPGSTHGSTIKIPPGTLGGIDAKGNIYIGLTTEIDVYVPGARTPFRRVTNGLASVSSFTVNPDGSLFVPNAAHYVGGIPTSGNLVEFAANGSSPNATRQASDDTNPQATALRPASR
jgi:hypothetical protein